MQRRAYRAASRYSSVSDLLDQIQAAQHIGNVVHASDLRGIGLVVLTPSLVGSHGDELLDDEVHREGVESQQEDLQKRLADAFDHELCSDNEVMMTHRGYMEALSSIDRSTALHKMGRSIPLRARLGGCSH